MLRNTLRSYSTFPESKVRFIPKTGVYPSGFLVNAVPSLVKKNGNKDLCLLTSTTPCQVSGVFTTNKFCAAPVIVSKNLLHSKKPIHSLIVNSGCANACTGEQGLNNAVKMQEYVERATGRQGSLVMSTGVIGQHLQMDKIQNGIASAFKDLGSTHEHWKRVSEGIMTTDTFPKLKSQEFTVQGKSYRMAGWSKGAGMIHPNMATMLASVFTDAHVSKECLDLAIKRAVEKSFNAISIDGDTSTNDSFVVMANGQSGVSIVDPKSKEFEQFCQNLETFSRDLAHLIVRDGEGATKFVEIHVRNAKTVQDAKTISQTIATSPLVKTAIYGKDANWGRVVCAVGYSGVDINPEKVNLHLGSKTSKLHLFKNGMPFDTNEEIASKILDDEDLLLEIDLGLGSSDFKMYTCDLSHEYISINADYRS
ncbi:hypothetical protein EDD86DRAFT_190940 [Gorgonomyces haynaldii]|nr:hypothetical protein EDD86DRAFT_190940 [Gorgonomyces haynaldii]